MRRYQQGATTAGFIIMAAIVGIIAFGALKVTPMYLEQMKVASILSDVKAELDGTKTSPTHIRSAINKRINIEMVRGLDARQFKISKNKAGNFDIHANFERRELYIANVYLVVVFDKTVEITT